LGSITDTDVHANRVRLWLGNTQDKILNIKLHKPIS